MSDTDSLLAQSFRRLLEDVSPLSTVRQEEQTPGVPALWSEIEASGFLEALVPEAAGGAGLSICEISPIVMMCGEFAAPAPIAETMIARKLLQERGAMAPSGAAIVLAPPSPITPLARKASHALVAGSEVLTLVEIRPGLLDPFGAGGFSGALDGKTVMEVPALDFDLLSCAAALTAARMAGGMARILDMTIEYANQRFQFGRPLSKFQAIQHQLAVAAQETVAAQVSARIGMSGTQFDRLRSAVSKARTGKASEALCDIAHAVHGAIGVTEEYELQVHTRRLKQGQLAFGSSAFWTRLLGEARCGVGQGTSADFVRLRLQDAN